MYVPKSICKKRRRKTTVVCTVNKACIQLLVYITVSIIDAHNHIINTNAQHH